MDGWFHLRASQFGNSGSFSHGRPKTRAGRIGVVSFFCSCLVVPTISLPSLGTYQLQPHRPWNVMQRSAVNHIRPFFASVT